MKPPYDDGDEDTQRPDIDFAKAVIVFVLVVLAAMLMTMCGPR